MNTSFPACWNMRLSSSEEVNDSSSPQLRSNNIKLRRKLNATLFPKEVQQLHRESLRCSRVKWAKWGHGQDYIKSLREVTLIPAKQKGSEFSWEVLAYYWALCTGLSERQMQMDMHFLSYCTVEVSKQYSERTRASRTLSLLLTHFWPGGRKLTVRCESGLGGLYWAPTVH